MTTELTYTGKPIHPSAKEDRWVDFTKAVEISGRTLSGTPTVTEYTVASDGTATLSTDWTISGVALNTSAITLTDGGSISANLAVVYTLDGTTSTASPTSGTNYRFEVAVATSNSETLVMNVDIACSSS